MLKHLESGKDKIQQICDLLRCEALQPAEQESYRRITEGESRKQELIAEGQKEKERLVAEGRAVIEQERRAFDSSLAQAIAQALETLKQQIEHTLFHSQLQALTHEAMSETAVVARIVESLVQAVAKEGLTADLAAEVARTVNAKEVNEQLTKKAIERLEGQSVQTGTLESGAQLMVRDKKMTVAITGDEVKKLLADHLRHDFRRLVFASA